MVLHRFTSESVTGGRPDTVADHHRPVAEDDMTRIDSPTIDDRVYAILEGGPRDLPAAARYRREPPTESTIKVAFRSGYEHFERVEPDPRSEPTPVRYRWTRNTRIAE